MGWDRRSNEVLYQHRGESSSKGKQRFSLALFSTLIISALLGVFGLFNIQAISLWLGANSDTSSYVIEYLNIMFLFGWVIALEQVLSIFVRNDGSPKLSMIALATTSIVNIILNFYTIMILNMGVTGAAISTVLGGFAGLLVLSLHFFNRQAQLRKLAFQWSRKSLLHIFAIGFPSFLAEAGLLIFVTGYNLAMSELAGTGGSLPSRSSTTFTGLCSCPSSALKWRFSQ